MILSTVKFECWIAEQDNLLTIIVVCYKVREEARQQALDTFYRLIDELNLVSKPGILPLIG